jgi:hypothetical protein
MSSVLGIRGKSPLAYPVAPRSISGPGTSPFLSQPAWFVDPQNASGNASNGNTGATALTPLLTKAELLRRIGAQNGPIQVPMSVDFLNEELPGQGVNDEILIDTSLFSLVWTMPTTVIASGTLTAATAKNRAAGVAGRQTVSGPNINTNVGLIFEDMTLSARSFIRQSLAGTTAVICSLVQNVDPTPLNPFAGFANVQVDPVAGNTYRVLRPGRLNMAFAQAFNSFNGALVFVNTDFHGASATEQFVGTCYTAFCSFANFYIARVAEGASPAASNCAALIAGLGIGEYPTNIPFYEGGGIGNLVNGFVGGAFFFDGDVLLAGGNGLQDGTSFSLACLENFFVVGFRSNGGANCYVPSGDYGPPILWGDRLFVYSESKVFWQWDRTATQTFLVALHIEANGPINAGDKAFAIDVATGNKATAPSLRLITPANLDTPVAAGGFAMGDPIFGPTGAGYAVGCSNGAIVRELA